MTLHRHYGYWLSMLLLVLLTLMPEVGLAASASLSSPQTISGFAGGPFGPASQQLTIIPNGFSLDSCYYDYYNPVSTNATWLQVSAPSEGYCNEPITLSLAPNVAYVPPGHYQATVTVNFLYYDYSTCNGECPDTPLSAQATVTLDVKDPTPTISITSPANGAEALVGKALNFTSMASSPGGLGLSYHWAFPDGTPASSTQQNPGPVAFSTAGQKQVKLTVIDTAGRSASATVTVNITAAPPAPTLGVTITNPQGDQALIAGQSLTFASAVTSNDPNPQLSFDWSFGDGATPSTSTRQNPGQVTFAKAGNYPVTLEVTDATTGIKASAGLTVTVRNSLSARIVLTPRNPIISAGTALTFGSSVASGTPAANLSYRWDFGSGASPASSTQQNPGPVTFNNAGTHTVRFTATDTTTGETASDSVEVTVQAQTVLSAAITSPAGGTSVQVGEPVNFSASASPATSPLNFSWNFGPGANPATSNVQNPTNVVFSTAGAQVVELTVTDPASGQQTSTQITVNVESSTTPPTAKPPDVTINGPADGTSVVVGGSLVFSATASAAKALALKSDQFTYLWQFGPGSDPATSTSAGPITVRFNQIGTNVVQLTVTDTGTGLATVKSINIIVQQPTSEQAQSQLEMFATTPGERSVASVLGQLCTQTGLMADLQRDCANLLNSAFNNDPLVGQALASLTPDIVQTPGSSVFNASMATLNIIQARLQSLLAGSNTAFNVNGMSLNIAGNTLSGQQLQGLLRNMTGGSAGDTQGDSGFSRLSGFISGRYGRGSHDTTDQLTGYNSHNTALTLGADYRFSDKLILGAAVSYNDASTDFQNARGNLDTKDYAATLYGSFYQNKNLFFDGSVTYGRNSFNQQRHVSYALAHTPAVDQTFFASFNGDHLGLDLDAGYQIQRGGFTITPSARLQYLKVNVDGYQETGISSPGAPGSGWAIAVDPQSYKSFTINLGGQVSYAWSQSWGVLLPYVGLTWVHDFQGGNNGNVDGHFLGDPTGTGFALPLDNQDSNYFNLEIGASAQFTHGTSGFISYRRILGYSNASYYSINAGVRLEF